MFYSLLRCVFAWGVVFATYGMLTQAGEPGYPWALPVGTIMIAVGAWGWE